MAAVGLIEQRGDADRARLALLQEVDQVGQGDAAIHDIFDDQQIGALDGEIEILGDLDFARAGLAFAVAGDAHEIDESVDVQGAGQVGHEEACALENADQVQVAGGIVAIDLGAHFAHAGLNPFFGEEYAERAQWASNPPPR